MFKAIWVAAILSLSTFTKAKAGSPEQDSSLTKTATAINDTLDTNDSIQLGSSKQILTDPKQGFKDLFITDDLSNGLTVEKLNPLAVSFVQDYMARNADDLQDMKDWGKPYFDMMDNVLTEHNLPKELKYLAVIESALKPNLRSWAGAVGPWQFMPTTARNMGLKVTSKYDERRDYYKSTHAASKYLTYLYGIYGDWLLVIAAYNGGPGRVNSAIRKSGSRDFWKLQYYLPNESRNHVKKFIATHYIMEGQGSITTLTKEQALIYQTDMPIISTEDVASMKTTTISGRYNSKVIAKYVEMDIKEFNRLNPTLDKTLAVTTTYQMKLPEEKLKVFLERKNDILNASVQMLLNPDYKL